MGNIHGSDWGATLGPDITGIAETGLNDVRDIIVGGEDIIDTAITEIGLTVRTGLNDVANVIENTEDDIMKLAINTENDVLDLIEHTEDNIVHTIQLGLVVGGIIVIFMLKAGSEVINKNPELTREIAGRAIPGV